MDFATNCYTIFSFLLFGRMAKDKDSLNRLVTALSVVMGTDVKVVDASESSFYLCYHGNTLVYY